MKSFFRGICRYSISAICILLLILVCNLGVFLYMGYQVAQKENSYTTMRKDMERVGKEMSSTDQGYVLSSEGKKILKKMQFVWAMALNEEGTVVWEWKVPKEIPRQYSLFDVASFSRWYLNDYPVRIWKVHGLMLVFADSPQEVAKLNVVFSLKMFHTIPKLIRGFLITDTLILIFMVVIFAYRFYASMKPISQGIEKLSRKEAVHVKERGAVKELAQQINITSQVLQRQQEKLSQRDRTRAEWIAGVSHDIRTPLTLIVGYAERLMEGFIPGTRERAMAETIQRQSRLIRQLIEDLNLTSKLSYDAFPLHVSKWHPAPLLRECVSDLYNEGLESQFSVNLTVTEQAEKTIVTADRQLIRRAIHNTLGNSIRHNPEGCEVHITLSVDDESLCYMFCDSGPGIPSQIVTLLQEEKEKRNETKGVHQPHIMGMRLTEQIVALHQGTVFYKKRENGNYDCGFLLPGEISKKTKK